MSTSRFSRRQAIKSGAVAAAAVFPTMSPAVGAAKSAAIQTPTNLRVMVWGRPDGANRDYQAYQRANPQGAKNLAMEQAEETVEKLPSGNGYAHHALDSSLELGSLVS